MKPGYKQTEVGVIPEEWEVKRLGSLGKFLKGSGITKDQARSGSLACVRYGELYTLHNDVVRGFQSWVSPDVAATAVRLKHGDILFAGSGETREEIGKCVAFVSDLEAYAGGDIVILRPDDSDSVFLGYYLNADSIAQQKARLGQGDAVVHISSSALSTVWCNLPPLPEQRAIAETLSDVDGLIDSLTRLISKKRNIKKAVMQQLLTGKRRLPGFKGEWEVTRLTNVAIFHKGKGLPKSALSESGTEQCIHYGELFTRYRDTIGEIFSRTDTSKDVFRSSANDVLMPTSDVTPRGLAKASCVRVDGVILGGDILVIRSDANRVHGPFLSLAIRHNETQVLQLVTGSTVYHLYGSDMKNFTFTLPPLSEQRAIAEVLSDMDGEIFSLEKRLTKTKNIKKAMMQELLTGKTRLV